MKEFYLEILTPSKKVYEGNVVSVSLPGTVGEFQILHDHAPIISTLDVGKMKIRTTADGESVFAISNGVAEVLKNKVLILVRSIENIKDIDLQRAEKAAERARKRISDRSNPEVDVARAEAALQRALNRMKLKTTL
ncbi:MAG: ATP synthase epsilon chain [Ignavibacteriaceae bacterium]|nr:MAG: ATP synthase F1 subunit epsilon [Chlorobiota bacterium]GJQ32935.1 MAG: ATP synthase epsilon chain [Ignavibacteriaceae bacterium]